METLEHTARIVTLAYQLGNVNVLPQDQVDRLMELREKFNVPGKITACKAAIPQQTTQTVTDDSVQQITKKVLERLKKAN
jgi:hypothetical protein